MVTKTGLDTRGHLSEGEPFMRISEERAFQDRKIVHVKALRQEQDGMSKVQHKGQ